MKVFFDTSVLVSAFLAAHENHSRALPVIERVHEGKDDGFVSAHTLIELCSLLTRVPSSPRITPTQASTMVNVNVLKHFTVVALTVNEHAELIEHLGQLGIVGGKAIDMLHLACAAKCEPERIYSFNAPDLSPMAGELASRIMAP